MSMTAGNFEKNVSFATQLQNSPLALCNWLPFPPASLNGNQTVIGFGTFVLIFK